MLITEIGYEKASPKKVKTPGEKLASCHPKIHSGNNGTLTLKNTYQIIHVL